MKKILLLSSLVSSVLSAQVTHTVIVGGSTIGSTPPFYDPQHLTINVGDIVLWQNQGGTHNVNGSTTIFPANPEGFSSGNAASGNWTFQHTFTIPGTYNYHCTSQGHSATQFGSIVVLQSQSIDESSIAADVTIFPVPANDLIVVDLGKQRMLTVELIGVDGRTLLQRPINGNSRIELNIADLPSGQYYIRIIGDGQRTIVRPFRKS